MKLLFWLVLIISISRLRSLGWQSVVRGISCVKARQDSLRPLQTTAGDSDNNNYDHLSQKRPVRRSNYDLGIGKNKPLSDEELTLDGRLAEPLEVDKIARNWIVPEAVVKPTKIKQNSTIVEKRSILEDPFDNRSPVRNFELVKTRRMIP
jgi:hypothetical protein